MSLHLNENLAKKRDDIVHRISHWIKSDDNSAIVDKSNTKKKTNRSIEVDYKHLNSQDYSKTKIEVMNILWGKNNSLPGNNVFSKKLFQPELLTSKSVVLDLSIGLGACARMIADESFAKIDGLENDTSLIPSLIKSLNEKQQYRSIKVLKKDLEHVNLAHVKYDLIYGREAFFKIKNKHRAIEQCSCALRQKGRIIFTDFVLQKDVSASSTFKNWSERERQSVYPTSITTYMKIFKKLNLKVGHIENYSDEYISHVNKAWVNFKKHVAQDEMDRKFMNVMLLEGDLWLSRVRALKSSKLKLLKFQLHL